MKKILIVDDDPTILESLKEILALEGFKVACLSEGERTLKKIKEFSPDLVILDIFLSCTDGLEICQRIKKQPQTKALPVIMISAHNFDAYQIKKMGANDFIAKPFAIEKLLGKVNRFLS